MNQDGGTALASALPFLTALTCVDLRSCSVAVSVTCQCCAETA